MVLCMEWITPGNAFLNHSNIQPQALTVWIARNVILAEAMTKTEEPGGNFPFPSDFCISLPIGTPQRMLTANAQLTR